MKSAAVNGRRCEQALLDERRSAHAVELAEREREKEELRRALTAAVAQLAAEKEEAEERAALAEAALAEAATVGPTPRRSSEAAPHRPPTVCERRLFTSLAVNRRAPPPPPPSL